MKEKNIYMMSDKELHGMPDHKLYVYDVCATTDVGWQFLMSYEKFMELSKKYEHNDNWEFSPDVIEERLDNAIIAAKASGFYGKFREGEGVHVFFLPAEHSFCPQFVFKQDNNGQTFVVSIHPMPHLENEFSRVWNVFLKIRG